MPKRTTVGPTGVPVTDRLPERVQAENVCHKLNVLQTFVILLPTVCGPAPGVKARYPGRW